MHYRQSPVVLNGIVLGTEEGKHEATNAVPAVQRPTVRLHVENKTVSSFEGNNRCSLSQKANTKIKHTICKQNRVLKR